MAGILSENRFPIDGSSAIDPVHQCNVSPLSVSSPAGGPAAEAGLKMGDAVLAIDGRSTKDLLLPEVRDRFKTSAPGTNVRLTVKSGEGTRDVTLVLRDLV